MNSQKTTTQRQDGAVDSPQEYRIHGMDCAEEVAILKREIGPIVGTVDQLGFDILNGEDDGIV